MTFLFCDTVILVLFQKFKSGLLQTKDKAIIVSCHQPPTGLVARHMAAPTEEHWAAAKGFQHNLAGTANWGIIYRKQMECIKLVGYGDADYAVSGYQAQHERLCHRCAC